MNIVGRGRGLAKMHKYIKNIQRQVRKIVEMMTRKSGDDSDRELEKETRGCYHAKMEEGEEYKNDLILDEKMGRILEGRNDGIKIEV